MSEKVALANLACFLRFLAVENHLVVRQTLDAAAKALEQAPACTRIMEATCKIGYVGNKHTATEGYLKAPAAEIVDRMAALPKFPATVAALINNDADEPPIWRALAGASETDDGEPSWGVLGRLFREERFLSIWNRVRFMRDEWSVPTNEFVAGVMPYIEDHPRKNVVLFYGQGPRRDIGGTLKLVQRISLDDLELHHSGILVANGEGNPKARNQVYERALRQLDPTYRDHAVIMRYVTDIQYKAKCAKQTQIISPHGPAGICALIDFAAAPAKVWEKKEGRQAAVLHSLGSHYVIVNQWKDARDTLEGLSEAVARHRRLSKVGGDRQDAGKNG